MSEIERAIEYYQENEFYMQKYNADLVTVKMNKLALTALKEQLEREKNPLKCDGCIHLPQKYNGSIACENCSRGTILLDRYEPKGEPNV